jgi:hypothetical protein
MSISRTRWNYHTMVIAKDRDLHTIDNALEKLGHDEWGLVAVTQGPDSKIIIFERAE